MHILKRVLLLCLLGAIAHPVHSQPAASPDQARPGTNSLPKQQVEQKQDTPPTVSDQKSAGTLDADAELKARELVRKLTSDTPEPAGPAKSDDAKAEKPTKAPEDTAKGKESVATSPPIADQALQQAERDKEIARIEAAVEEARKRRAEAQKPSTPPTAAAPSEASTSAALPTPVTPSPAAAAPESAKPTPAAVQTPGAVTPVLPIQTPVVTSAPAVETPVAEVARIGSARELLHSVPASPDQPTLTPEAEEKARDLVRRNTVIIFSDNPSAPSPQRSSSAKVGLLVDSSPAPRDITVALADPPAGARPSGAAPTSGSNLNSDQEQRARELLRQLMEGTNSAKSAASPRSGVLPPRTNVLDLPPNSGGAAIQPQTAKPATEPPVIRPLAVPSSPSTISAEQEAKARELLNQRMNEVSAKPAPTVPPPTVVTPAPVTPRPAPATVTAPSQRGLTAEQEDAARSVVSEQVNAIRGNSAPVAVPPTVVTRPQPQSATPPVTTPAVTVAPAPPTAVTPPVTTTQSVPGTLTPEQEAKARAALEQAQRQVAPVASITPNVPPTTAPPSQPVDSAAELKAKRELIKEQEREGKKRREAEKKIEQEAAKKRAEQDAKVKKEMERLDKEAKAKARDDARKQLEAEAKQEAKLRDTKNTGKAPTANSSTPVPTKTAPPPQAKTEKASKSKNEPRNSVSAVPAAPGSKKQRLDSLTDAYLHDKVTAEDYHRQRAKILAEPGD